jgi:hypothetical protein
MTQSWLHKASPSLQNAAFSKTKIPILGTEISARVPQAMTDFAGRNMEKMGAFGQKMGNAIPQKLLNILGPASSMALGEFQASNGNVTPQTKTQSSTTKTQAVDTEMQKLVNALKILDPSNADVYDSLLSSGGSGESGMGIRATERLKDLYGAVQDQGMTAESGGLGRLAGIEGDIAAITQPEGQPEAAVYKANREAFLSSISRASGEKGTLTDKDIDRIRKALPTFYDTPEVAEQKWVSFDALLKDLEKQYQMQSGTLTNIEDIQEQLN